MTGTHREAGAAASTRDGSGFSSPGVRGAATTGIIDAASFGLGEAGSRPIFGYALRAGRAISDEEGYDIVALDRQGRVLLTLGSFDETSVVAIWRSLGQSSGLPLLIEDGPGQFRQVCDQIGRLRLGRARTRRRLVGLSRRRPRFLLRRKPGRVCTPTRLARLPAR